MPINRRFPPVSNQRILRDYYGFTKNEIREIMRAEAPPTPFWPETTIKGRSHTSCNV